MGQLELHLIHLSSSAPALHYHRVWCIAPHDRAFRREGPKEPHISTFTPLPARSATKSERNCGEEMGHMRHMRQSPTGHKIRAPMIRRPLATRRMPSSSASASFKQAQRKSVILGEWNA